MSSALACSEPDEPHTIKVVVAGTKSDASLDTALVHDYFVAYSDR